MTFYGPPDPAWNDDALHACQAWINAWRTGRPRSAQPSTTFARHLGECAIQAEAEGTTGNDLVEAFRAAGYDGACGLCGRKA